jgi:hypothetical protein
MRNVLIAVFLLLVTPEIGFAITKKAIKASELPAAITADISSRYLSYSIVDAYKVNDKNIITFEVIINSKKNRLKLYYSSDYKFLRQEILPIIKTTNKK